MTWGWMWIAIMILAIVVESLTDQLVSIWFAPAAIVATVLDFFPVFILWQVLAFLCVSALGIFIARRLILNRRGAADSKTDLDMIVGEKCLVTEKIDSFAGCGQAKVRGQIWSAKGLNEDDIFEEGEVLQIVAIEGVKLICKKL
ncbi:MAG: NfeD family protein [Clostridia bacterium]|nr:NfeD family protein [Clostridia bacterium]